MLYLIWQSYFCLSFYCPYLTIAHLYRTPEPPTALPSHSVSTSLIFTSQSSNGVIFYPPPSVIPHCQLLMLTFRNVHRWALTCLSGPVPHCCPLGISALAQVLGLHNTLSLPRPQLTLFFPSRMPPSYVNPDSPSQSHHPRLDTPPREYRSRDGHSTISAGQK